MIESGYEHPRDLCINLYDDEKAGECLHDNRHAAILTMMRKTEVPKAKSPKILVDEEVDQVEPKMEFDAKKWRDEMKRMK